MVETPKYDVVKKIGNIELRKYGSMILASTEGDLNDNEAFMRIANYIFGDNTSSKKIPMTAPVITSNSNNKMKMSFVMPSSYTLKTIPKPNSSNVKIKTLKSRNLAVLRFSGFASDSKVINLQMELISTLKENKIKPKSDPFLMRYNSPWTIPFLRRNEVAVEI
jgi:effector-binding domain-containing protein